MWHLSASGLLILHDRLLIDDMLADRFYVSGRKLARYNLIDNWLVNPIRKTDWLEETIDKFTSTGKKLCLLGDFNLCLQKIETFNYNCDFLLAL